MKAISELAKEALELSPPQRLTPARILLDLSDEDEDFSPEAETAWEEEICRRMDQVKTGRARFCSFENVFERLDGRFPG